MRTRKDSPKHNVTVQDLLSLVPSELYDQLASEFNADKWVHKLRAEVMFKLILYSILYSERLSLRVMEWCYASPNFQVLADAVGKTAHNSIRDRLRTISVDYFAGIYDHFYQQVEVLYGAQMAEGKYHLRRFDSTVVSSFAHLLDGMRVGNTSRNKVQGKFTVEYKDDLLLRAHFHHTQAYLSEETALGNAVKAAGVESDEIFVFDRGLQSRATFVKLHQQGKRFITRLNPTLRYEVLTQHDLPDDQDAGSLLIRSDAQVYLYTDGHKRCETPWRLIQATMKDGQPILFLTNLTPQEVTARQVAQFYHQRWDIEVLFRFMKQEMNLNHFVCNDPHAITIMLYGILIASTMILIYKKQNEITSYKKSKILFVKELVNSIIYDMLQTQEGIQRLKELFKPPKQK